VRRAAWCQLSAAGYTVNGIAAPAGAAGEAATSAMVVKGTLEEFMSDVGLDGFSTRLRVRLVVVHFSNIRLDKDLRRRGRWVGHHR
jgi:hypothetical protein